MKATHLECSLCGKRHEAGAVANLCDCGGPLLVRYDLSCHPPPLAAARGGERPGQHVAICARAAGRAEESVVTLGEGWTPLLRTCRLGARIGAERYG